MPRPRPFRYAADPVCVTALLLYALNRWHLKPHAIGGAFTAGYFNDVLCLPLFVPLSLYVQRLLRVRCHDGPPRLPEIAQHLAVFSIVFEWLLPSLPQWFRSTADPYDVLAYAAGGGVAYAVWSLGPRLRGSLVCGAPVPSPLYSGERVRVRGSSSESEIADFRFQMQPLTPALSPEYRGEGVRSLPPRSARVTTSTAPASGTSAGTTAPQNPPAP